MTGSQVASLIISIVAVALSGISVLWQWSRSRWERPVVEVTLSQALRARMQPNFGGAVPDPTKFDFHFTIVASNVGEKPVTITGAGVDRGGIDKWFVSFGIGDRSTDFPLRLEPHDLVTFEVKRHEDEPGLQDAKARPYVIAVVRSTWWQRRRHIPAQRPVFGRVFTIGEDVGIDG
jgi:hypothetical protein